RNARRHRSWPRSRPSSNRWKEKPNEQLHRLDAAFGGSAHRLDAFAFPLAGNRDRLAGRDRAGDAAPPIRRRAILLMLYRDGGDGSGAAGDLPADPSADDSSRRAITGAGAAADRSKQPGDVRRSSARAATRDQSRRAANGVARAFIG